MVAGGDRSMELMAERQEMASGSASERRRLKKNIGGSKPTDLKEMKKNTN